MPLLKLRELTTIANNLKKEGKKTIFTNGCFDILHIGHVRYLEDAKKLGDILIVGVNSDESVRILKGKCRPIIPDIERAEILAALKCVDYVVIFNELTPENIIAHLKPSIHVKGGDYVIDQIPESKLVESFGGKTIILNEVKGKSTSGIIQKILTNNRGSH
jgi:rfaE bifunctional protein nucleotidyltransferase chain/domain